MRCTTNGGGRRFTPAKDAGPFAELHGQLAVENREALDQRGMAVRAGDTRSDAREQFGDHAALGVLVRKLKNRGTLAGPGIFPDLVDLDRRAVRRRVRIGMRHGKTPLHRRDHLRPMIEFTEQLVPQHRKGDEPGNAKDQRDP